MITAWRLVRDKHADSAFTGEGARLYGGRWNLPGIPLVYLSGTLSLAALELFIHLNTNEVKAHFVYFKVEIPDSVKIEEIASLPRDWRERAVSKSTQELGSAWAQKANAAVLRIPSVLIPIENNYILNPVHQDFNSLIIRGPWPFQFDPRMW